LYSLFIFVYFFIFIIRYQNSNLRALVATFIMVEIIDPSQYLSSPYHVSSQQHMIYSLSTQEERQLSSSVSENKISHSILFSHESLHLLPLKVFGSTCLLGHINVFFMVH